MAHKLSQCTIRAADPGGEEALARTLRALQRQTISDLPLIRPYPSQEAFKAREFGHARNPMSKQYATFYVSWRDSKKRPFWFDGNEADLGRAAADALEIRLNELAEDGWIIDRIVPASGLTPRQCAAFTIIAFK